MITPIARLGRRCSARASIFAALAAVSAVAQGAPPVTASPLAANARFVYVVQGERLLQLDAETLAPQRSISLQQALASLEGGREPAATRPSKVRLAAQDPAPAAAPTRGQDPAPAAAALPPAVMPNPAVLQLGLKWLSRHQDKDGRWDADEFNKHDTRGERCDGEGNATYDVGVTGLSLLAFLGEGSTLVKGDYRDQIKRGVDWLVEQQQENGLIGVNASHDFIYGHAIASFALVEAYGLSEFEPLKAAAQKAIDYLEHHRNPYSVWRYQPRDNDNDTSVTVWALHAYRAAKDHGLEVSDVAFKVGAAWLDEVTDAKGRVGYTRAGEPSSRLAGDHLTRFPPELGEAMTAAGLSARFVLGGKAAATERVKLGADLLAARPPVWDVERGSIDPYYWMWGSRAMFQVGGDHWQRWLRTLVPAVEPHQRKEGNYEGSWDPIGVWDGNGGRVYATAMYVMALQVAARFAKVK